MSDLKPGDLAIVIDARPIRKSNIVCVVTSSLIRDPSEKRWDFWNKKRGHWIEIAGYPCPGTKSGEWFSEKSNLRRLPPKETPTTWEQVEALTGWNPGRVEA